MNRLLHRMILFTGLASAMSMIVVGPAQAQSAGAVLDCGAVITEDTVLGADVGPCGDRVTEEGHTPGGHGVVIGADSITLDLNGHTIFGLGGSVVLHQAAGVKVDGHSDVTVFGGTVRDFFHGVQVINGSHNKVFDMEVLDNTTGNGIVLQNVRDSSVFSNSVIGSGAFGGISVFDGRRPEQLDDIPSANNTITDNIVDRANHRPNTAGISLENGSGHRIINNTVTGSSGDGINLRAGVTRSVVANNVVTGNGTRAASIPTPVAGIALRLDSANGVGADSNQIVRNRVEDNFEHGIFVASKDNRIVNNRSLRNGVDDLHDTNFTPPCDDNIWRHNTFDVANQACVTR